MNGGEERQNTTLKAQALEGGSEGEEERLKFERSTKGATAAGELGDLTLSTRLPPSTEGICKWRCIFRNAFLPQRCHDGIF